MKIINYSGKYNGSIKDLLIELQEYIADINKEKYDILANKYREKCF